MLGVSVKEIESLNPQYRRSVVNGGSRPSVLRLQPKDIIAFIDNNTKLKGKNFKGDGVGDKPAFAGYKTR